MVVPRMVVGLDLTKLDDTERNKIVDNLTCKLNDNVCVLCRKEFESKTHLEVHFWDHTDDKFELECLICGALFFLQDQLIEHIKSHHPNPGQPTSPTSPLFKLSKYINLLSTLSINA